MCGHLKQIRAPSAAGIFYPEEPADLRHVVKSFLENADVCGPYPKAMVIPHAGYRCSGPVAACGYRLLDPIRDSVKRVVLLGPSHHDRFYGLAASSADEFATPLGNVAVDMDAVDIALRLPQVHLRDKAHADEHSLEVQLPFLQLTLHDFELVPLVIGKATDNEVAETIDLFWDDTETLIIVSSDLSHHDSYSTAKQIDSKSAQLVERCQYRQLTAELACGYLGIRGLLMVARERSMHVKTIDLHNSVDMAGPMDRVVGYGSFIVY